MSHHAERVTYSQLLLQWHVHFSGEYGYRFSFLLVDTLCSLTNRIIIHFYNICS